MGEPQVSLSARDEFQLAPSATLPSSVDVAIIGGGIAGCATAYFLARQRVSVALCEKGRIAGEQSGRNWGWVRQQGRSTIELPLMMRSLSIWKGLSAELGEDLGFVQRGCLYLAENADQLAGFHPWLSTARTHELDTQLLTPSELERILAGGQRWAGALYTASDGRAEPNRATLAIARGAQRAGAWIASQCAVRGVETAAGKVEALVTERGRIRVRAVVCAAVAIRRRADGGYSVAHGSRFEHSIVPATFALARKFAPALRARFFRRAGDTTSLES